MLQCYTIVLLFMQTISVTSTRYSIHHGQNDQSEMESSHRKTKHKRSARHSHSLNIVQAHDHKLNSKNTHREDFRKRSFIDDINKEMEKVLSANGIRKSGITVKHNNTPAQKSFHITTKNSIVYKHNAKKPVSSTKKSTTSRSTFHEATRARGSKSLIPPSLEGWHFHPLNLPSKKNELYEKALRRNEVHENTLPSKQNELYEKASKRNELDKSDLASKRNELYEKTLHFAASVFKTDDSRLKRKMNDDDDAKIARKPGQASQPTVSANYGR